MQLADLIIKKIKSGGPIPFRDFMDMALYYPGLGYYTSNREKIGKDGDYYTSPVITPVFGSLIAKQIEEMWELLGKEKFTIVEYGAGNGDLCESILNHLKTKPEVYEKTDYCIIEKSAFMRHKEQQKLREKVRWHNSISEINDLRGCILSNELVDNFPVHVVCMKDELKEVFVDYKDGFRELLLPAGEDLKNYFDELKVRLPENYRTEVNLQATEWMKEISSSLQQGYVMTIDYGSPSHELYSEYKSRGTLTCFHKQKVNDLPYRCIGEQDITAHVNFSALCLWGFKNGLEYCGYRNQADFLLALGFRDHIKKLRQEAKDYFNYQAEAFLTHTFLSDMSKRFKVLIQQKSVDKQMLSGLRPL